MVGDKMKGKWFRTVAGCVAAAVLFAVPALSQPVLSAECAILLDAETGRVLFEHNADQRAKVASTTKIMTGLLVAEECSLDAQVAVPAEAVGVEGSSINLKKGEILSVEELLYGLMLHSGNDAAVALAIYCSGSVAAFAEKMNCRAEELGLHGSNYVNPHGLDEKDHYATARDLAVLTAAAMEQDVFRSVVSTKKKEFKTRTFTNHNKLLWKYEGAVGVKTGYTSASGRVLVSAAERDGRRLIAVTIRDRNDWADHMELLDYGFSSFSLQKIAARGEIMGSVPVISGADQMVQAVAPEDVLCTVHPKEAVELFLQLPAFVYAPVLAGDPAGTLSVMVDGKEIKKIPLIWRYSVLEEA